MAKFKYSIYDVDVGGVIDENVFTDRHEVLAQVSDDLDSYSYEKEYADEREQIEHLCWSPKNVINSMNALLCSPFFGECSIWLPGHHRKVSITREEGQSNG